MKLTHHNIASDGFWSIIYAIYIFHIMYNILTIPISHDHYQTYAIYIICIIYILYAFLQLPPPH
ncbi:hypothetical protein Halar_0664 (plasmid) [halophilic archaeon DL31]|jgi:hypothetical protein|nr:hypothetical protein Halar_0664 [halophilic archaeon DL31]